MIAVWIRGERIGPGERMGDDPGLSLDLLGPQLKAVRRGALGPWTKTVGPKWTRVAKRIAVPPDTRDAILSVGLLGATGLLEIDDLAIDLIPIGTESEPNLVRNGDFELGDPDPVGWMTENGARRAFPGRRSPAAIELTKAASRLLTGIGAPLDGLTSLKVTLCAKPRDLRGADAAFCGVFFLDEDARPLPGTGSRPLFRWSGSSDWTTAQAVVAIPEGALRAVLQVEKTNGSGSLWIDDVQVTANPMPDIAEHRLYHIETKKDGWLPVAGSKETVADSALDASFLLDAPAGRYGFVRIKNGRLAFEKGGRARFFGVDMRPPSAFLEPEVADALADRLARSGVNLVRLGDLDAALGPTRSLIDDTREDTAEFDPISLERLDHLIAALKKRGIYVAIELQSARRFRQGDDVPSVDGLPVGGGPAAIFDPKLRAAMIHNADALLGHVNPETGLALKDDPVLAWTTLFGEVSLFDLIDDPHALPADLAATLKNRGQGRSGWRSVESVGLKEIADELRSKGVRAPIAGVSHWRRETEFAASCAAPGIDLIDDRLFWSPSAFLVPDRKSLLWSREGGLIAGASKKRKVDRPYVVGQWCDRTSGAWALPYEGGDLMIAAVTASAEDWDGLVRRGIFINPRVWGSAAPGTGGIEDVFALPEIVNAIPPVYGLMPHAASLMLRGRAEIEKPPRGRNVPTGIPGWDSRHGRLRIDTPHTQAVAGWIGAEGLRTDALTIDVETPYAVVAVSSFGSAPIKTSKRLLVTAIARVEPTGFLWADEWKRDVADPGRPPLLQEPVRAKVSWRRAGAVKAYALDADGKRAESVELTKTGDGVALAIDGKSPGMHWEIVVE